MVCSTCLLSLGNILYWLTNLYGLLVQAKPPLLTKHRKFTTLFVKLLLTKYGKGVADKVSILYGGSVKPDNAKEIFAKEDVDGGLIGGAALKADDFVTIIKSI